MFALTYSLITDDFIKQINALRRSQGLWTWAPHDDLTRLAEAWVFWGRLREVKDLGKSPLEVHFPPGDFNKRRKLVGKMCNEGLSAEAAIQDILIKKRDVLLSKEIYNIGAALLDDGECVLYAILMAKKE